MQFRDKEQKMCYSLLINNSIINAIKRNKKYYTRRQSRLRHLNAILTFEDSFDLS